MSESKEQEAVKIKFKTAETAKCTFQIESDMSKSPHEHKKGAYEYA